MIVYYKICYSNNRIVGEYMSKKMKNIILIEIIIFGIGLLVTKFFDPFIYYNDGTPVLTPVFIIFIIGLIITVFVDYAIYEGSTYKSLEKSATVEQQEKLDILNTQRDSGYVKNYAIKLVLIVMALLAVIGILCIMIFVPDFTKKLTDSVDKGTFMPIVLVLFVIILLVISFIIAKRNSDNISIMKKLAIQKYPNCNFKVLTDMKYPDGKLRLTKEGVYEKDIYNYSIEIPEYGIMVTNVLKYNIESYRDHLDGHYEIIPTKTSYLDNNILEYSYPINKNIVVQYTHDFTNVLELQNNMELILNVKELSESRFLKFRIENNRIYISKMIKNKGIKKQDCIKDINDIQVFKEKIVDIINK